MGACPNETWSVVDILPLAGGISGTDIDGFEPGDQTRWICS